MNADVIIIGGGLAGLCNAIHLSKFGKKVLLIEKNEYPKHKVCGEYVSNETLPYLDFLGFNPFEFGAKRISKFQLTTHNNKSIEAKLPLGGFGISRYEFDFQLYHLAIKSGVEVLHDIVINVDFEADIFRVETKSNNILKSKIVIFSDLYRFFIFIIIWNFSFPYSSQPVFDRIIRFDLRTPLYHVSICSIVFVILRRPFKPFVII